MIEFTMLHPRATQEMLGFIPYYFTDHPSVRAAGITAEMQMVEGYKQTAGCKPNDYFIRNNKFEMSIGGALKWPGDPWMQPIAEYKLGDEMLRFYESEMFSIQQPDRSFKVWRLD